MTVKEAGNVRRLSLLELPIELGEALKATGLEAACRLSIVYSWRLEGMNSEAFGMAGPGCRGL